MLIDFERVLGALMGSEIEPNRDQVRKTTFTKNVIFLNDFIFTRSLIFKKIRLRRAPNNANFDALF